MGFLLTRGMEIMVDVGIRVPPCIEIKNDVIVM